MTYKRVKPVLPTGRGADGAGSRPSPPRNHCAYFFAGSIFFSSAWVALIVADPPDTPSLAESTVKVSEPIWIVATPPFTDFTSPINAPVLSFTDMPLVSVVDAPALAAVLDPAPVGAAGAGPGSEAGGVGVGVVLVGAADGAASLGAAELGAPVVAAGGVVLLEAGGAAFPDELVAGAWAKAAVARVKVAAAAA
jgi:hypothetical protein